MWWVKKGSGITGYLWNCNKSNSHLQDQVLHPQNHLHPHISVLGNKRDRKCHNHKIINLMFELFRCFKFSDISNIYSILRAAYMRKVVPRINKAKELISSRYSGGFKVLETYTKWGTKRYNHNKYTYNVKWCKVS